MKEDLDDTTKGLMEDKKFWARAVVTFGINDKEKIKSIADVEDLIIKIEEYIAASASLNTEIKNLERKVAENQDALDKATVICEKQLA
eukprot:16061933-Heterocapsa_arctica.AAC.1